METKITDKVYLAMQEEIKSMLVQAFKIKAIGVEDLLAILFILGQTNNSLELETFVDIFSDSFPVLKDYEVGKRSEAKSGLEEKVRQIVTKMVAQDPLKATEIAKTALKPGMTWDELIKEFPEIENAA